MMFRRIPCARYLLLLVLVSTVGAHANEPENDAHKRRDEALLRRERLRAAGVPEIYVDTRFIEVDTSMYDIFIDGYQTAEGELETLPALSTNAIQVVHKDAMRQVTERESKPDSFGLQYLYSDVENGSSFEGVVLDGIAEVKIGTRDYDFHDKEMPNTFPNDPKKSDHLIGVDFLHAPRLLLMSGDSAAFQSGYQRDYMERDAFGCLQVRATDPDFTDGAAFTVGATRLDDGNIKLDPLELSFMQMVGRERIAGVPFDVGKPIVQTAAMSMSLVISQKATAVFALPRFDESAPVILVLIRTYEAKQTPPTPTATQKQP